MRIAPFDRRVLPPDMVVDHVAMADGWVLRRMDWRAAATPRGNLLFLSGRADFGEKYLEAMAHWRARGWHVTSFDWRGQGGSAGAADGAEPAFDLLLDDLAAVIARAGETPGRRIVVAHSMGGHLALRLIAERGWRPDAAVLVAPMLGIATGPLPLRIAAGIARGVVMLGLGARRVWHRGSGTLRQQTLTGSAERYADEGWWAARNPGFVALPPRWAWLDAAYRSIAALGAAPLERVAVADPDPRRGARPAGERGGDRIGGGAAARCARRAVRCRARAAARGGWRARRGDDRDRRLPR